MVNKTEIILNGAYGLVRAKSSNTHIHTRRKDKLCCVPRMTEQGLQETTVGQGLVQAPVPELWFPSQCPIKYPGGNE